MFTRKWRGGSTRLIPIAGAMLLAFGLTAADASAAPIEQVFINPILVRNDDGSSGVDLGSDFQTYVDATIKIWDQADILVNFLAWSYYNETDFLSIDSDAEFVSLTTGAGHGQSSDPLTINVWFVDDLYPSSPGTTFGVAYYSGANGIAIADETFSSSWLRYDTIAHELGHNLGLEHDTYGAGDSAPLNLMTRGAVRTVPSGLADIYPDGGLRDQLTAEQIEVALASDFTQPIPEPSTIVLSGLAIGFLVFRTRRKRAA